MPERCLSPIEHFEYFVFSVVFNWMSILISRYCSIYLVVPRKLIMPSCFVFGFEMLAFSNEPIDKLICDTILKLS